MTTEEFKFIAIIAFLAIVALGLGACVIVAMCSPFISTRIIAEKLGEIDKRKGKR